MFFDGKLYGRVVDPDDINGVGWVDIPKLKFPWCVLLIPTFVLFGMFPPAWKKLLLLRLLLCEQNADLLPKNIFLQKQTTNL